MVLKGTITHLAKIELIGIDLIPVFLVYLIAKEHYLMSGCLAFFMGILTDVLGPCQLGLFAFTYSVILLGINHCRQVLDFNNTKTSMVLVAAAGSVKWVLVLVIMRGLPLGQSLASLRFVSIAFSALITALITPLLFRFLNLTRGGES